MEQKLWLIGQLSLKTMGVMIASPLFWLTIWFTYRYYRQYEWDKASAGRLALASSLEGIGAGFFVIWLIALLGLTSQPGPALICLGPVSMLLSLYRPRFLCMAYGAGLTVAFFWIMGWPVDAAGITSLVAVLHLAEGLLVLLLGGRHTVTIYQQNHQRLLPRRGIYRFWPVPVCLMIIISTGDASLTMPDWWPLLPMNTGPESICGLLPLAVTLGYSDLSSGKQEVRKRRVQNGILILSYAAILLCMSLLSVHIPYGQPASLIFMVLGHEAIVKGRSWTYHDKTP